LLTPEIAAAAEHAHRMVQGGGAPRFTYLDVSTAAEVEALAETILPGDDSPGAREAGVVYFIDRALATFDRDDQRAYRDGMKRVQAERRRLFPGSKSVAALSAEQRNGLMRAIEKTPFFELLRKHTVMGFLANPSWGGNRDQAGWKLIGFRDADHFDSPFGYYDDPKNGWL
jgi:gluconate 2-dehydrogenase gamma chain